MHLHERSFGGFRLSPKPPTRWDEGSSSRCSRRKREAQSCQPISPAVQQYSLTLTAFRNSTKTTKNYSKTRISDYFLTKFSRKTTNNGDRSTTYILVTSSLRQSISANTQMKLCRWGEGKHVVSLTRGGLSSSSLPSI